MANLAADVAALVHAVEQGEKLLCIHYACENFYEAKDRPAQVTCLAVASPEDLGSRSFSLADDASDDMRLRERRMLTEFYSFMRANSDSRIVHWNMNSAEYGFSAIARRFTWMTGDPPAFEPSSDRTHDLDALISYKYGSSYVRHPKLRSLVDLNALSARSWLSGQDEAARANTADYSAIARSTAEKARSIARLTLLFAAGSLVTQHSAGAIGFAGERIDAVRAILEVADRMLLVQRSLNHRHDSRAGFDVNDEYDVQDLLRSLLVVFFDDVRAESTVREYAGGASRIDFVLPQSHVAVEIKKSRGSMTSRDLANELIIDRDRYAVDDRISHLVCLVFDLEGRLINPRGLEVDLSRDASVSGLSVTVKIIDR